MKLIACIAGALALAACAGEDAAKQATETEAPPTHQALIDRYLEIYKAKDVEAMLALYDEDILGVLYPTTLFGRGIAAAEPGIRGDFEGRPNAYAELPRRFRIAPDKWVAFGESINAREEGSDERAPLWILFDLNQAGDKIEATYTQIAFSGFIEGASVDEPTPAMRAAFASVFEALSETIFNSPADHFALTAALYSYPPVDLENFGPVIAGGDDVYSVLAFKWGEGAWREDAFISQYMQFVFVGMPGSEENALDRVALFTFDADPASPSYEKVIRVDVMGPSGG